MSAIVQELRHALRTLSSQFGFSALVVAVLGAGLACVLFMLVVLNTMIVRPLPYANPERLVHAGLTEPDRLDRVEEVPGAEVLDWQQRLAPIGQVGGYSEATINLSDGNRPERFDGAFVTSNLFDVLGVQPQLGRTFVAEEGRVGGPGAVMLSHSLWKSRYNGDPAIVGKQLRVNTRAATVVGVMPEDFSFPRRETVWIPTLLTADPNRATDYELDTVVRLADGSTVAQLETALAAWHVEATKRFPEVFNHLRPNTEPMSYAISNRTTRAILNMMFAAVLLVLLVACANAANLLLSRTLSRRQELAVRVALGASRWRLALHLMAQTLLLSTLATAIALPVARGAAGWVESTFRDAAQDGPPHWMHFDLDWNIVAFAVVAALVTGLLTGLLPALRASGEGVSQSLRDGGRAVSGGAFARISRFLVVAEIALSCVLLISAGVMVRGILSMSAKDVGIANVNLLTGRVALFETSYPQGADQVRLFERLVDRLRAEPGVAGATSATALPGLIGDDRDFVPDGTAAADGALPSVGFASTDDHFIDTYGLGLRQGRYFDARDIADSERVAVVDEEFATRFFAGASPVGRSIVLRSGDGTTARMTVIGMISRLQLDDIDDARAPTVLVPLRQEPARFVSIAVRTTGVPLAFATRLAAIVREVDADTPVYWVRSYDQVIREATFSERILARLFSAFGVIALVLAAAGLYGVIAFNMGQRTREIGVRRALGAPDRVVLGNVLGRSAWQVAIGLGAGLALGIPFAGLLAHSLQGFESSDPLVWIVVVVVLGAAAALAAWLPARRALRVDPIVALRYE